MIDYEAIKLGEVFEKLRRQNLMSQEDLAWEIKRDRKTISDLENDKYKPGFETLVNLAYAFKIPPSKLMLEIEKGTNLSDYFNKINIENDPSERE